MSDFAEPRRPDEVTRELVVSEIFGPTLQGEGPTAGTRCGFVRLGRCNLDCAWCDTPYTWDWARFDPTVELRRVAVEEVVAQIETMGVERVVVTGGEPLLQQRALAELLSLGLDRGWRFEVETNGTIKPDHDVGPFVDCFNVSLKLANSGVDAARRVRGEALAEFADLARRDCAIFKFVVTEPADLAEIYALVEDEGLSNIWVMPEGTTADQILSRLEWLGDAVIARGWNLTPRLHILLWGDQRGR